MKKTIEKLNTCEEVDWVYSPIVKDHFFAPRNFLNIGIKYDADGKGLVGSPECGDLMTIWIKVDKNTQRITECKWRMFGCASAIASASMLSVMATENGGMDLVTARALKPQQIVERLGWLPHGKFHCSVLGHEALREAVKDYLENEKKPIQSFHPRESKKGSRQYSNAIL